jgi:hypothetical protein
MPTGIEMKKHHAAVRFSFYTAVISFITAATIFALYFFSGDGKYAFYGIFALAILGIVNVSALVMLGVVMAKNPSIRRIGGTTILFQLFNIPVAIVCLWAGTRLQSIARITFVNETGSKLENVEIMGCEVYTIEHLAPGECETVWISIPQDCMISLTYPIADSTVFESVSGYFTPGMGTVETHQIGGKN